MRSLQMCLSLNMWSYQVCVICIACDHYIWWLLTSINLYRRVIIGDCQMGIHALSSKGNSEINDKFWMGIPITMSLWEHNEFRYNISIISVGVPCSDSPAVANSKQRYEESAAGIFITYICDYAHYFSDRTTVTQIQCVMAEGRWSHSLHDCQSKCNLGYKSEQTTIAMV